MRRALARDHIWVAAAGVAFCTLFAAIPGVTVVVVRKDLLGRAREDVPAVLDRLDIPVLISTRRSTRRRPDRAGAVAHRPGGWPGCPAPGTARVPALGGRTPDMPVDPQMQAILDGRAAPPLAAPLLASPPLTTPLLTAPPLAARPNE